MSINFQPKPPGKVISATRAQPPQGDSKCTELSWKWTQQDTLLRKKRIRLEETTINFVGLEREDVETNHGRRRRRRGFGDWSDRKNRVVVVAEGESEIPEVVFKLHIFVLKLWKI